MKYQNYLGYITEDVRCMIINILLKAELERECKREEGRLIHATRSYGQEITKICFANAFRGQTSINLKRSLKFDSKCF